MSSYQSYWRTVDRHGVLHLANSWEQFGTFLCGSPPAGNLWTDPAGDFYAPGRPTGPYKRVCPVCNERSNQ